MYTYPGYICPLGVGHSRTFCAKSSILALHRHDDIIGMADCSSYWPEPNHCPEPSNLTLAIALCPNSNHCPVSYP